MSDQDKSAAKRTGKSSSDLAIATGLVVLAFGATMLTLSIIYASSILALIGLGMVFWGLTLTYVRKEEYVKEAVLNATETSLLATLTQTLQELDYRGKAVYLPPKYLNQPESSKAYIPKQNRGKLPAPEQIQKLESQASARTSQGMLMTPPGAELARLFENMLGTSFTRTNLDYLQENLPKLLIDDLEIVSDLELHTEAVKASNSGEPANPTSEGQERIYMKIASSVYQDSSGEATRLPSMNSTFGSPLASAIACALTKATGKPVIVENQETKDDGETIDVEYRVLEEEQT